MHSPDPKIPAHIIFRFCVVGINHHQMVAADRSLFAISEPVYGNLLHAGKQIGLRSLFALSTCNRSELYGYCHQYSDLTQLLIEYTNGTKELFEQAGFVKQGYEAFDHLFKVAAGLDSQIIGDYEVLGQLKSAVRFARQYNMIGPIMDRTINFAVQASKTVKTNTQLSTGTVSVSYAVIEWLRQVENVCSKKILLFGTGKFGKSVIKNLKHYFDTASITIINRTDKTGEELARETLTAWMPFHCLTNEVNNADIVIVCTNAAEHCILPGFFSGTKKQWILDLSVPQNVHPEVKNIPGITVTGLDEVSRIMQANIAKRNIEVPKAIGIIKQYQQEFYEWLAMNRHMPLIKDMKDKLYTLSGVTNCKMPDGTTLPATELFENKVKKTVSSLAMNLRIKKDKGCQYINAINEFLQPTSGK